MSVTYAKDVRNSGGREIPEGWGPGEYHQASVADTGTSHTLPGRLYVVQCEWCPDAFAAKTKAEAMSLFRQHEHQMAQS